MGAKGAYKEQSFGLPELPVVTYVSLALVFPVVGVVMFLSFWSWLSLMLSFCCLLNCPLAEGSILGGLIGRGALAPRVGLVEIAV